MLGKTGRIISWTVIRVPSTGFSSLAPYPVVIVDLPAQAGLTGGGRITAQLVDWQEEDVTFGRKVKVVIRRVSDPSGEDIIPYGIKVKPL